MTLLSVHEQRQKALDVLSKKCLADEYNPIDFVLDDECRRVLNLPNRPANANPYVGWMVGKPSSTVTSKRISSKGLELIKAHEGCRTTAYKCPAGVWTIGFGHTSGVRAGMKISQAEAERFLLQDIAIFEEAINTLVRVPLDQNQFDALVSFVFNVGIGAFRTSTLLGTLNKGAYRSAALQFHRWVRAGGQKLDGLIRRRNDEYGLFLGED